LTKLHNDELLSVKAADLS